MNLAVLRDYIKSRILEEQDVLQALQSDEAHWQSGGPESERANRADSIADVPAGGEYSGLCKQLPRLTNRFNPIEIQPDVHRLPHAGGEVH